MREVGLIRRVADTDVTVLIRGESGTGKEMVARGIHRLATARKPFVKVNCAACPRSCSNRAVRFRAGAFTGAIHTSQASSSSPIGARCSSTKSARSAAAAVEAAPGAPGRRVRPARGRDDVRVDVRMVAATNRDLEVAVADGQFREDLFFRLNVVCITLPPLRHRPDEIPALTGSSSSSTPNSTTNRFTRRLPRRCASSRILGPRQRARTREPRQAPGDSRE